MTRDERVVTWIVGLLILSWLLASVLAPYASASTYSSDIFRYLGGSPYLPISQTPNVNANGYPDVYYCQTLSNGKCGNDKILLDPGFDWQWEESRPGGREAIRIVPRAEYLGLDAPMAFIEVVYELPG